MSKDRETYLKFKPMADDLRKAESWCELDGVLNRYQTVKNLYKMGYRKQSDGEWVSNRQTNEYVCSLCGAIAPVDCEKEDFYKSNYCPNCGAKMKGGAE